MTFELAAYGVLAGFFYGLLPQKKRVYLYSFNRRHAGRQDHLGGCRHLGFAGGAGWVFLAGFCCGCFCQCRSRDYTAVGLDTPPIVLAVKGNQI